MDCSFQHDVNPAFDTSHGGRSAEGRSYDNNIGTDPATHKHETAFPAPCSVVDKATDRLLVPVKMLLPGKVKTTLQTASVEGSRIVSVAMAEQLLLAINASNALNTYFVGYFPGTGKGG